MRECAVDVNKKQHENFRRCNRKSEHEGKRGANPTQDIAPDRGIVSVGRIFAGYLVQRKWEVRRVDLKKVELITLRGRPIRVFHSLTPKGKVDKQRKSRGG